MPKPVKTDQAEAPEVAGAEVEAKSAPAKAPKKNSSVVEREAIADAKEAGRVAKKAEMRKLRPVTNYPNAATSMDDFVKADVEVDDEDLAEEEQD